MSVLLPKQKALRATRPVRLTVQLRHRESAADLPFLVQRVAAEDRDPNGQPGTVKVLMLSALKAYRPELRELIDKELAISKT